ncbi:MAG: hypothetical protein BGO96_15790 [Micrococcales bacterium 73-15]|uniref:PH-like domain-containing protein n=1 Tax=Salana multivorans TaxID=120377 RepID=UPI00096791C7|nr:hypothetical protein [Salana multivorans]OJX94358.1 MAG: hypothetical protein BGO96_15790 [Micrococcales bacterium 73-15]
MNRGLAAAVCVLIALVALGAMWWGWRRRARRTGAGLAELTEPWEPFPADAPGGLVVEGIYVSTTTAGDWLDRIAAAGLGVRSAVTAYVDERGLLLARRGAPDVAVPARDLVVARRERGIAGKVADAGGLVVVRWRLGDRELDTGVRPRYSRDLDRLVDAVNALAPGEPSAPPDTPTAPLDSPAGTTQKGQPTA